MKALNLKSSAIIVFFCIFLNITLTVNSQDIAIWNFETQTTVPFYTEANMTANSAVFGSYITGIAYYSGYVSLWAYSGTPWSTGALNPNAYLDFTISPVIDYMLNLSSFKFAFRRSSTGIRAWELRSSLDGFTSAIASNSVPDDSDYHNETVLLPPEFLNITTTISFRIYGYNAEASGGTCRFDNVIFTGTVEEVPLVPLTNVAVIIGALLMVTFVIIRFRRN